MNRLLSLGLLPLFIGVAAICSLTQPGSLARPQHESIQDRFVGAWRLAWLEQPAADGKVRKADCSGLLVYTRDGHMSVQVMFRNPQAARQAGPVQYAEGGYEASFGTYEINEGTHTFHYHVDGALVRSLVGTDLTRVYELSGKHLIVKSPDPNEHWKVAWEHY